MFVVGFLGFFITVKQYFTTNRNYNVAMLMMQC